MSISYGPATQTALGVVQLATDAEAKAVSSTTLAVTPGNLAAVFAEPPALGSTTKAAVSATKVTCATGTITTSQPVLDVTQTWNAAGVTFTGLKANITNTASAAASLLMDLQVGGVSQFNVTKAGQVQFGSTAATTITGNNVTLVLTGGSVAGAAFGNNGLGGPIALLPSTGQFAWSSSASISSGNTGDTFLVRDAANTLAQRNGTNAQIYRLYGSYTDSSNYERLTLQAVAAGDFKLIPEAAGTGTLRGLQLGVSGGKLGFYGTTAVTKPTALTAADASTLDAVWDATEVGVVNNIRTRLGELESRLQSLGLLT